MPVCRLSGMRATTECAQLTEWFVPGTEPKAPDDWERGGRVALPEEYAEWARQHGGPSPMIAASASPDSTGVARLRILSPQDGDRYAIPAGIESRYATISLRAGGVDASQVRWSIDGVPYEGERWPLAPGVHVFRAVSARGESVEARIAVER
jgi:hypothetical protein